MTIGSAVMMDWQLSGSFGWGVYGVNLMLHWNFQQKFQLLTNCAWDEKTMRLSPIEWGLLNPPLKNSAEWHAQSSSFQNRRITLQIPVLHALGNDFLFQVGRARNFELTGSPSIGVIFFESTRFSAEGLQRARALPLIVAGSTWNQTLMKDAGVDQTALVLQGVDLTRFHPARRAGWFANRFVVFSGGKLEHRKGQDLVLKAFRIFAARHEDALLVAAWDSPWPALAAHFSQDPTLAPVPFLPNGKVDCAGWAAANGIRPEQFVAISSVPNGAVEQIYREMDVGLFPNRAEGGTNLVAMECMACGVPVVLSANTGHLDLIASDRCIALTRQGVLEGAAYQGWGESNLEEIVQALETVYSDRAAARAKAAQGVTFMSTMTWAATATRMAEVIAPYL